MLFGRPDLSHGCDKLRGRWLGDALPGASHGVLHRGSQFGCVVSPIAAITGSIGLPHTVHSGSVSRKSAPSAPSVSLLVGALSGGAVGSGGSAPVLLSAPAN